MLELIYKMQPLDYVYLLVGIMYRTILALVQRILYLWFVFI